MAAPLFIFTSLIWYTPPQYYRSPAATRKGGARAASTRQYDFEVEDSKNRIDTLQKGPANPPRGGDDVRETILVALSPFVVTL